METGRLHPWNVSPREAIEIQNRLSQRIQITPLDESTVHSVAGADTCMSRKIGALWAGVVVLSYPGLEKIEEKWITGKANFPYVPGLLSFREIPALIKAFQSLKSTPDLVICDGQGIAHPRRLGLASHLGLVLDIATIGCAKSRLVGEFSKVGPSRGDFSPLLHGGEVVGAVLRTRSEVRPTFVSPGHKITLEESIKIVLGCCTKYRLPEPTRQAHLLVNRMKKQEYLKG
jgi:deoxyribonuclease V